LDGRDPVTLDAHSIEAVISGLPVYATHQKPDILLVSLSKKYPRPGTYFKIDSFREYTLACASGMDDVGFFQKALIQRHHLESAPPGLAITHAGWDRIASVSSSPLTSKTAFVAMSFNDEMLALWRPAFHAAIDRAKFEPRIANDPEHNDQIDAKIVAEIKQCRFLVADTTFASAGVYFEAGYALGLGKPVIWTCRRDRHKEDMHFDTRQYNNVLWDKAEDLADKLYYRISATI
jgi:nucleoside 2-deoxyribosyltransferase